MNSPVVLRGVEGEEEWAVVAYLKGAIVQMTPKHFPVCGSYDECIERAAIYRGQNQTFARKWAGWHFAGMRVDGQITY